MAKKAQIAAKVNTIILMGYKRLPDLLESTLNKFELGIYFCFVLKKMSLNFAFEET